jgi:hypothetical protein
MSSLNGGSHRPGEPSIQRARVEDAYESGGGDGLVRNHTQQDRMPDTDPEGDLGHGLAAPYVVEPFWFHFMKLI